MKKLSLKRLSILGLVLMAASAVTAAILPSKDTSKVRDQRGNVGLSETGGANSHTCIPATSGNCNVTAASGTTGGISPTVSNTTTVGD